MAWSRSFIGLLMVDMSLLDSSKAWFGFLKSADMSMCQEKKPNVVRSFLIAHLVKKTVVVRE